MPRKPPSRTSVLLPPPSTWTGNPSDPAKASARFRSSRSAGVASSVAGPPIRKDVYGASGASAWTCPRIVACSRSARDVVITGMSSPLARPQALQDHFPHPPDVSRPERHHHVAGLRDIQDSFREVALVRHVGHVLVPVPRDAVGDL